MSVVSPRLLRALAPATLLLAAACAGSTSTSAPAADGGESDAASSADASIDSGARTDAAADAPGASVPDGASAQTDASDASTSFPDAVAPEAGGDVCNPETCNLQDDDCNGVCDDLLGCRIGVDRSYDSTNGQHFYTTTDAESACCGYTVEQHDAFYLYGTAQAGLVPLYRCVSASGAHLYTTDPGCEGETSEGSMGWIATGPSCGAVPLYRLYNASTGDHLYTTSSAEVTSAEGGGYAMQTSPGYVWSADCGGTGCTWPSPVQMVGSALATATGFPTAWYGFPIHAGPQSFASLQGTVSVTNSENLYAEVLFILQYLPTGTCTDGLWPASTPEYGPPGGQPLGQFIVKAPTQGTFTVPIDFTLPGGLPMSSCVLLGLNGGPVSTTHAVTSAASLTLAYTAAQSPAQSVLGAGGEFCFGQSWGCQAATTNDAQSFANVTPVTQAQTLVALYGDISDSTFDGTSSFGAPPAGAWTGTNDFYVYHGAECSSFGVASGTAGPGSYTASIPADAIHLLSVPLSGSGIGVSEKPVFQSFSGVSLAAGDCLVTLWGLQGGGGFDNETQVFALVR
jgi:hypothetical protein